jgi:hypothetical protein
MPNLNVQIRAAIDAFDVTGARELLREALKEPDAETYYLASQVALNDEQKRQFLEKSLLLEPFHERAFAALQKLTANEPSAPVASTTAADGAELRELGPGNFEVRVQLPSNELVNMFFR